MGRVWQLVDRDTGRLVVAQLQVADRPWSRLAGWQFRRRPPKGAGLLLVPCRSIHTCFVQFPLHVVGLDAQGRVTSVHPSVEPWRPVWCAKGTHAVLELPADGPPAVTPGQCLLLAPSSGAVEALPARRSLRFLGG